MKNKETATQRRAKNAKIGDIVLAVLAFGAFVITALYIAPALGG